MPYGTGRPEYVSGFTTLESEIQSMTALASRVASLTVAAALGLAASTSSAAATESAAKDEISHLLQFVASSSCTFVRNGTEYPPDKARDHLETKYKFVGSRISTADEFIKYLATGSSISGEPYHVHCGKTDALSGAWLVAELNRYRASPHFQTASRNTTK